MENSFKKYSFLIPNQGYVKAAFSKKCYTFYLVKKLLFTYREMCLLRAFLLNLQKIFFFLSFPFFHKKICGLFLGELQKADFLMLSSYNNPTKMWWFRKLWTTHHRYKAVWSTFSLYLYKLGFKRDPFTQTLRGYPKMIYYFSFNLYICLCLSNIET